MQCMKDNGFILPAYMRLAHTGPAASRDRVPNVMEFLSLETILPYSQINSRQLSELFMAGGKGCMHLLKLGVK